jgi:hypothetical protein
VGYSTAGNVGVNWTDISTTPQTFGVPPAGSSLIFDPNVSKNSCVLSQGVTSYASITTSLGYTGTISQANGANLTFGVAAMTSGTLNIGTAKLEVMSGQLGSSVGGSVVNITGGGELDVNAGDRPTLDNANLNASVRVTGGTLSVGNLTLATGWFYVTGGR